MQILEQGVIRATNMPWTNRPCVCFTECVWGSLLDHAQNYSSYGLGFHKETLFKAGGGPAFYMRQDLFQAATWPEEVFPFITPFVPEYAPVEHRDEYWSSRAPCDYTNEREWRIPHDFEFDLTEVEFITVARYEDEAQMPTHLKDAIGRANILLMDNYSRVNALWPWHHY